MSRLLVELSAEHPLLPRAELAAVLDLVGGSVLEHDGATALAKASGPDAAFLAQRLGLAHSVCEHWWSGEPSPLAMAEPFQDRDMGGASFAIRARRLGGAHATLPLQEFVKEAGALLARSGTVDLEKPDVDVRILVSDAKAHVGRLVAEVDRKAFEARSVKHRAHFAPVSLHPRYARALVNLARIRPGERVADPFCGTGGLVLEAALLGADVLASDLDPRMVAGTRAELARAGVRAARVEARDVGELPEFAGDKLDVVLSDPPYGKSSTTNRESMGALYERFLAAAHDALKPGGRLAVIFPSGELRERAAVGAKLRLDADEPRGSSTAAAKFELLESYEQRVHRSMTRHYGIFQRR